MTRQLVSVVIPAYNAASYVSSAIRSVYLQTYRPLEVVVINDASTDDTVSAVEKTFDSGPSDVIKSLVEIRVNSGAANALRTGFMESKGDYVCWLSADDAFVEKEKTAVQVRQMVRKRADWSYCRAFYAGRTLESSRLYYQPYIRWMRFLDPLFERDSELRLMCSLFRNPVHGSSVMISRKCFDSYGLFDPTLRNVDPDGDLWFRYHALNLRVFSIARCPIFYRIHPDQVSKQTTKMLYGKEVVRLRILTVLSKLQRLNRLIKRFSPFLVILYLEKELGTPFTTEFVCNRILADRDHYSPAIIRFVMKAYDEAKQKEQSSGVDRSLLDSSLTEALKSEAFVEFEKLLATKT